MSDDPLARLTSGGWLRGLLRFAVAIAVVAAVLAVSGEEAWAPLVELRMLPYLLLGAAVHLLQRAARIKKWQRLIAPTELRQLSYLRLMRVQLVGMLANLLLPVSEAMKVWAVAKSRTDILVASRTLIADMALASALMGVVGMGGAALYGRTPKLVWLAGGVMVVVPIIVLLTLHYWTREHHAKLAWLSAPVHAANLVETMCQAGVYALAARAIGIDVTVLQVLSLAPILYLADLVMITPSGLGLREALFAVTLTLLATKDGDAGVAMGLTISAMLLIAGALGGAIALTIPDGGETDDEA